MTAADDITRSAGQAPTKPRQHWRSLSSFKRRSFPAIVVRNFPSVAAFFAALWLAGCSNEPTGVVKDEALLAGVSAAKLKGADDDYFHDMDYGYRAKTDPSVALNRAEARGRNSWIVWSFGNDRFWDYMSNHTFGAFDLLKVLSSPPEFGYCTDDASPRREINYDSPTSALNHDSCTGSGKHWVTISRDNRWKWYGLVNEPCFTKPTAPDEYGLWLDKRDPESADCPKDPFENETKYPGVKIGARGSTVPVGSYYGRASGIVGLRLFPNPDFDEAAKKKWNAKHYYTDASYYNDQTLVRPYRVGMSCGFCHVGPNPSNPPPDPENPKWEHLNSNPGAQYFWVDRIFIWNPINSQSNFIFQLFHTSLPGSLDTSFVSTDYINNPRTMNAIYNVMARIKGGSRFPELLAGGELNNKQFNDFPQTQGLSQYYDRESRTVKTSHVLKDGSDSAGVLGALNRVFVNIGLFSEEWLRHFRPLIGGKEISPIRIAVLNENSVYWQATINQTPDMALFLLKTAQPDKLKHAPGGASHIDESKLDQGKTVFAENCARCHSSKQPPNLCPLGTPCKTGDIIENTGEYFNWMRAEVHKPDFLDDNFLSSDRRVPMTDVGINACSPLATNAIRDNIWDDFSSEAYKNLPPVGEITLYDPYSGEPWQYTMPAGGRGYVRPASLVSVWSTAPLLQNNSIGDFNEDPSVEGRLRSFDSSIKQMLWPETRRKDDLLREKVSGPSWVQRTTTTSYIKVPAGYLPSGGTALMNWAPWIHHLAHLVLPWVFTTDGDLQIGPIPRGTPVNLIANIQLLAESPHIEDKVEHAKKLLGLLKKLKKALSSLPPNATDVQASEAFRPLVKELISISKCPDYIINKGHYFGSNLSDDDKNALIEFLKTF
jgi:hypothetical protein